VPHREMGTSLFSTTNHTTKIMDAHWGGQDRALAPS